MDDSEISKKFVEKQYVPVEVARKQIHSIEEDMRQMRKRHLKLVKEMDENYKLIEVETQEHFSDFLEKWKSLAKNRINQYRSAFLTMKQEKDDMEIQHSTSIEELEAKNKKLVDDYESLLKRHNEMVELGKVEGKDREELLCSQYEGELSSLRQDKIELEGLLEGMKAQNVTLINKMNEMKRRAKLTSVVGVEEVKAITDHYVSDCVNLVVAGIVSVVEVKDKEEKLKRLSKMPVMEGKATYLQSPENKDISEVVSSPEVADRMAIRRNNLGNTTALGKYEKLLEKEAKLVREILFWKMDFEEKEGRKCETEDCEPIEELCEELIEVKKDIAELKGESLENYSDPINSLYGLLALANTTNVKSAEYEKLAKESEDLRAELQALRVSVTKSMSETEAKKILQTEIDSLNKEKVELADKCKELETKILKYELKGQTTADDLESIKKQNAELRERMLDLNAQLAVRPLLETKEGKDEQGALRQEYDRLVTESIEQFKQIQKLEPLEAKLIEAESKNQKLTNLLRELKEKYKLLGLERASVGKKLLRLEELEAERAKARSELVKSDNKSEQATALKELVRENETLKAKLTKEEEEFKASQIAMAKITTEKEEAEEQIKKLKDPKNNIAQQQGVMEQLLQAEDELKQLRLKLCMDLSGSPEKKTDIIRDDYERVIRKNKVLKDKIEALEKKCASLDDSKKDYDDKVNEMLSLKQEVKGLQVENKEMVRKLGNYNKMKQTVADLRMQLADKFPKDMANVKEEMKRVIEENKELDSRKEEIDELKKQLLKAKQAASDNSAELEKVRQNLKKAEFERDRNADKAIKANNYIMERNSLRVKLAIIEDASPSNANKSVNPLRAELERMQAENAKLIKNLTAAENNTRNAYTNDEKINELEAKLKTSKEQIKELEQLLSKHSASNSKELEKQLERERQKSRESAMEMDKRSRVNDQSREGEFKELQEQIKKLEAQRKQDILLLQESNTEEIGKIKKDLAKAKSDLAKLTEENKQLLKQKGDLEAKSIMLELNIKRLEEELTKIGTEASKVAVLKETISELIEKIGKTQADFKIMQEKYKDELLKRKRLHNIIEDMKGKIRVYCRVRPPNRQEIDMSSPMIINVVDELTLKVQTRHGIKTFNFDSVFSPSTTQEKVFEDTKRLVQSAVDGYNVCIFAYGQTGTGKTFTIQGDDRNPGIAPRSFTELFRILSTMNNYNFKIDCYMVEIYVDALTDLLLPKEMRGNPPKLDIKEDMKGMMYVQDVTKCEIRNEEDAMKIFDMGLMNRKTSATQMNQTSSRSHLIFSILVETVNRQTKQRAVGKLSLVDLAGSERADKAGSSADRLKEAKAINKSLSALGNVISKLSRGGTFDYTL